jgi:hypothetical protein
MAMWKVRTQQKLFIHLVPFLLVILNVTLREKWKVYPVPLWLLIGGFFFAVQIKRVLPFDTPLDPSVHIGRRRRSKTDEDGGTP